jgi:uncharacterized protein
MPVLSEILAVALAAAPWLLLGLFLAGLIKALIPEHQLQRWVGGRGLGGIMRAAVIGAPLPLCSCGAIPTALALHRGGAGRGPTAAFMIGTPGIGADSVAVTYALLGPFMALVRATGAVLTAVITGLLVASTGAGAAAAAGAAAVCSGGCSKNACGSEDAAATAAAPGAFAERLRGGMQYAFGDLLNDIGAWILVGLIIAGVLIAFVPPQALAVYGSGLLPMLLMAVVGIPLYICATAATPIAAGMLLAGVSPGTALVFLLAGPITSMATLGVLRRELGNAALACYLLGILSTAVLLGLVVDGLVVWARIDVVGQIGAAQELLPEWLGWLALAVIVVFALRTHVRVAGRRSPA